MSLTKKTPKKEKKSDEEKLEEDLELPPFFVHMDPPPRKELRVTGIYGEIEELKCSDVVHHLCSLRQSSVVVEEDGTETSLPIEFVLSTPGGSAGDMFAVYDFMRVVQEQCEIHTLGIGKVMSAGVLLLAAGTKGKRRIGKHCRIMLHSVSSGHIGELHNLKNELEEVQIMQNNYITALATETDMTEKHIKNLINKKVNVYLTAQEAVDLGIADEVV